MNSVPEVCMFEKSISFVLAVLLLAVFVYNTFFKKPVIELACSKNCDQGRRCNCKC